MLVTGFPAGMFQTNCYVVAHDDARECVVVDPGQDAAAPLAGFLDERGLVPTAVLVTHGHLDHVWNVREVCETYSVPAYIHPADRGMLTDPASGIGPTMAQFVAGMEFSEPERIVELADGDVVTEAGIEFTVDHTPGHTRGGVVFRAVADGSTPFALTGDTLFQGSIGRTDLPGGDHEQLLQSIADRLLVLPDETVVLPGHGAATTIGTERTGNPFLVGLSESR
ncbi:MBL fold metallo-hydrolase [Rhodococcus rhodnii]|uniref:Hydrolase n=2 Tax=Rhodococcus rhodnii TaxID=38312 RepID=R7WPI5_9NOCA|nr:MBL fold metallo-hydrolase [Rhodococcus rhodnii]EOM75894.1 hydrolase [Rhodococcus rhodnii LMG 5362]TXG91059.1 MBL fold metallo-hydrolase [Rhodococcus rhodnii]